MRGHLISSVSFVEGKAAGLHMCDGPNSAQDSVQSWGHTDREEERMEAWCSDSFYNLTLGASAEGLISPWHAFM